MSRRTFPQRFPVYYGWVNVLMAAIAMIATFPGRTFGLGLIQKTLLADLQISETQFTGINFQSSILGALFCLPMGYLIDRVGVRLVSGVVIALLGLSVLGMTQIQGPTSLLLSLILIRGLGQTSLSIVSMAMIGKWFRGRLGLATGVYTVVLTIGFIATILGLGAAVGRFDGWRQPWTYIGWALWGIAPLSLLFVRSTPESCGLEPDPRAKPLVATAGTQHRDYTVWEAIRTPTFWVFVLGTSAFNMVFSAITLLNESVLEEIGFTQKDSLTVMAYLTGIGLVANFVAGALARRERLGWLLGAGMLAMAGCLAWLPSIRTHAALSTYAALFGFVGGLVTVVHFVAWGHLFGRSHLGRIQGVAQVVSVFASASGPDLIARCHETTGSYLPVLYWFAGGSAVLALAAFVVPVPRLLPADVPDDVAIDPVPGDTPLSPYLQPTQE